MNTPVHPIEAKCPIRVGEPCNLCESGASGPEDCGLVWLVMNDPELHARLDELRIEHLKSIREERASRG